MTAFLLLVRKKMHARVKIALKKMPAKHKTPSMPSTTEKISKERVKMAIASPQLMATNYETFMSHILEDLPPVLNERFFQLYSEAWEFAQNEVSDGDEDEQFQFALKTFQMILKEIPNWNTDRITEETEAVFSELPHLRNVLRQMITSRISILMSVRNDMRTRGNFEFSMPSRDEIVHHLFLHTGRKLRGKAKLYSHLVEDEDRELNTIELEDIIRAEVKRAIPKLVPVSKVVETHLTNPPPDDADVLVEEEAADNDNNAESDDEDNVSAADEDDADAGEADADEADTGAESDTDDADADESDSVEVQEDELPQDSEQVSGVALAVDAEADDVALAPEDAPADVDAAKLATVEGDSERKAQLKRQARELVALVEKLESSLTRIPKKQKMVRASLQEELDMRQTQLKRIEKKIARKKK